MNKNLLLIYLLLPLALFFFFIAAEGSVFAGWVVDSQGQLVYETEGSVLGQPATSPTGQAKKETAEDAASLPVEGVVEVETQERERVRVTELDRKAKRARLEQHGEGITIKLEDEEGEEIELPESTESAELEIKEPEDKGTVKVRPAGKALAVIHGKIAAQTHFPLMVNLETNELIVTTPAGEKVVTVLPDKAVENMLAANVIDQLGGKGGLRWLEYQEATPSATPSAEAAKLIEKDVIELTTKDGVLAYEIPGFKFKKFLGIFKMALRRTAVVSAETGELLGIRQTLRERILDLLSF